MESTEMTIKNIAELSQETIEPKTYTFRKQKRAFGIGGTIGYKMTEVTLQGSDMRLSQYTKIPLLPKYGKSAALYNVKDITGVSMKKVIDKRTLWILFLSLAAALLTGGTTLLIALGCFFVLHDKKILIHSTNGVLKISDVYTFTQEVEEMVAHLQRINPDIKNELRLNEK